MTTDYAARMDFENLAPKFAKGMDYLDTAGTGGVDPTLRELVRIHASQLNGCVYCIDMHTKDARAAGETEQRIYALPAWREAPYFTERERAALALTEAVTVLTDGHVPDEVYEQAAKHFREAELAQLISLIIVINAWNRIGVTTRCWTPGSYQP